MNKRKKKTCLLSVCEGLSQFQGEKKHIPVPRGRKERLELQVLERQAV